MEKVRKKCNNSENSEKNVVSKNKSFTHSTETSWRGASATGGIEEGIKLLMIM
jgi:hypothetical protein